MTYDTDHDRYLEPPECNDRECPACEGDGCEFCWGTGVVDKGAEARIKEFLKEQKQNY